MQHQKVIQFISILFLFTTIQAYSQVSISPNNTSPDSSAMLDISSTARGLLIPRMDSTQRMNIADPAPGLMVFDTSTMSFWYYVNGWNEGLGKDDEDWEKNGSGVFNNYGRVGIGTDSALATLHLSDTSNVLIGDSLSGSGFKAIYYASKGAFRCGYLNNPFGGYNYNRFWDYDSVGYYSWAGGRNSQAKGFGAFAFGSFGWADGSGSVAFFGHAKGNNSVSFGGNSIGRGSFTFEGTADDEGGIAMYGHAEGRYGVSIGGGTSGLGSSRAREDYGVAIGWNSDARGQASIALGPSDAYGYNAFSTGWVTEARGNYSSTFGYRTNSYPYASMALGRYNLVTGDSASWVSTDPIFIIGDGTSNSNRSNSFLIQKNGQTAIGYNTPTGMLNISTVLGSINNGGSLDADKAALLIGTSSVGMAFDANQIESAGSALHLNLSSAEDVTLVNGGGNVGIGTDSPDTRLHISGTDNNGTTATLKVTSGSQSILMDGNEIDATNSDLFLQNNTSDDVIMGTGGGKVAIGTSTSRTLLTLRGPNDVNNGPILTLLGTGSDQAESGRIRFIEGTASTNWRGGYIHLNGSTNRFHIGVHTTSDNNPANDVDAITINRGNGDVGIGTSNPTQTLSVNGDAGKPGGGLWSGFSDLRMKQDIRDYDEGLKEVLQIRPVHYRYNQLSGYNTEKEHIGIIAQELEAIAPHMVSSIEKEGEEYLQTDNSAMTYMLINAVKELKAENDQLKTNQIRIQAELIELKALLQNQSSTHFPTSEK